MKHYQLEENRLELSVKKTPLIIRIILFLFTFLFFTMPIAGMLLYIAAGNGFHVGFLFGLFFFGLMGFYLLRHALWNTYGKETIQFHTNSITYIADYGWFKDGQKEIEITEAIPFSIQPIGYEEDNIGTLQIGEGDAEIRCVTKVDRDELEGLIKELREINRY